MKFKSHVILARLPGPNNIKLSLNAVDNFNKILPSIMHMYVEMTMTNGKQSSHQESIIKINMANVWQQINNISAINLYANCSSVYLSVNNVLNVPSSLWETILISHKRNIVHSCIWGIMCHFHHRTNSTMRWRFKLHHTTFNLSNREIRFKQNKVNCK